MLFNGRGLTGFEGLLRGALAVTGVVALLFPAACGKNDDRDPPGGGEGISRGGSSGFPSVGGTSGGGGTSGEGGTGGSGGEGGEDPVDALAPEVRITSPEDLSHPDDGAVLVGSVVEVLCEASQSSQRGSEPVAEETVQITLLDSNREAVGEPKQGLPTGTPNEYAAEFVIADLPNGPVFFQCRAGDTSSPMLVGNSTIQSFVDHGPAIELVEPEDGSSHSVGTVRFTFSVSPEPLVDDDAGAEVDDVTLRVLDEDIPLDEEDGVYTATVDFSDTTLFPDPATDVQAEIVARNVRRPEAGERALSFGFVLDSVGPEITVESPGDEAVVGGEVRLAFSVADALSPVDERTVSLRLNSLEPVFFGDGRWTRDGDDFVYTFNSTIIDGDTAQTIINIEASDTAGNRSRGNPHVIYVDNTPPVVDLDPPLVREFKDGSPDTCSVAFDAVGPGAANDGDTVHQAQMFRAIVWSLGNGVPGQTVFFQAPTKQDSVLLYVLDSPSSTRYLLEDTNDDGVCDDIRGREAQDVNKVDLHHIDRAGEAWFATVDDEPVGAPPMPSFCEYENRTGDPPRNRCDDRSDLGRVISHHIDGSPPVIYALGNMHGGEGAACAGIDWELQNMVPDGYEGWICVAARAEDVFSNGQAGNHGVSRPLRLCYDDGVPPAADCPLPAPSCIAPNCSLPPAFPENFVYDPR